MGIKNKLQADLKDAMKSGATDRRDVLRSLLAAVKQVEIDDQIQLDDEGVMDVLIKQAKQHRESIADFEKGGRAEMVAEEQHVLAIIEEYLPKQASEDEIRALAAAKIAELGVTNPKGMGQVMSAMMVDLKGQADGKVVSQIVRELLLNQ
ncbi:MAG: GatB/YqeY domain-containing protein [Anaerolineales bacterium]|nr:GatB/YqeY domain-containing protein [Anaerolineales bacterium]